jgi:hypothetical protein
MLVPGSTALASPVGTVGVAAEVPGPLAAPDYAELGEGAAWTPDGTFSTTPQPQVLIGSCPIADAAVPTSFEVELVAAGAPLTQLATGTVDAVPLESWPECLEGTWQFPSDVLSDGVEYMVHGRSLGGPGEVSDWTPWSTFTVAFTPAPPVELEPEAGQLVVEPRPQLRVRVTEPRARELAATFRIVYAGTEFSAAEGSSSSIDEAGNLVWTPLVDLPMGNFEWQALLSDGISQSEWSPLAPFSVSLAPPHAPNVYSVYPVRGGVRLIWAPLYTGPEHPPLGYTVTAEPGGHSVTVAGDATEATIDGLPAGGYTVSVVGWNALGTSPAATRTITVAPASPASPEGLEVTLDGPTATLTWAAPDDQGDAPVDLFRVANPSWSAPFPTIETSGLSGTLTNLEYGVWYTAYVTSHNAYGWSSPAVASFAPFRAPDEPTDVEVRLGDGCLDLSWQPPAFDGGSTVTGYVVTANPGGAQTTTDGATAVRFPDLTNGVSYAFTVSGINAAGVGAESVPTTPRAPTPQTSDTDEDGLPDILEERAGSNVLLSDSDFDGLGDADEVFLLGGVTSPVAPDSDDDGVGDAESDSDMDGLANAAELAAGLDPANADSDGDQLRDGEEAVLGTDPLARDSDGDGLDDPAELRLALNPLAGDSDGDGLGDAEGLAEVLIEQDAVSATVTGTAAAVAGASVEFSGTVAVQGAITGTATVTLGADQVGTNDDPPAAVFFGGGMAGRLAAVRATGPIAPLVLGDLAFSVSAWQGMDDREYAAFEWNSETAVWEPSGEAVTASVPDRTVTVHSPRLGVSYTIVDMDEWRARARECDLAATDDARMSVEVVLDETASVRGLDPTGERFEAVTQVLDTLEAGDQVTMRAFDLMWIDFGYGYSYEPVLTTGPALSGFDDLAERIVDTLAGRRHEYVKAQIAELAAQPPSGTWTDYDNEFDGFAELAFDGDTAQSTGPSNPYVTAGFEDIPQSCRVEAIILVTDGLLIPGNEPAAEGTTPFRLRTGPAVYVMDVGPGGDQADWLRDVAERTGGAYTHVPTETNVPTWHRALDISIDPSEYLGDPDDDGIPSWVEIQGARPSAATGVGSGVGRTVFYSNPFDADTDNDGLSDGTELGRPLAPSVMGTWESDWPITAYTMMSDPREWDADHDNLSDTDELELGFNALNSDPDRDGLLDGDEGVWGTNPNRPDYDGDHYTDGFEALHYAEGYDPLVYNERTDASDWIGDFFLGAFCGDTEICRRDSWAWILGNAGSGVLIYGDVRDFVWSINDGEPVNTAIILAGAIPGYGDSLRTGAKIVDELPNLVEPVARSGRTTIAAVEEVERFIADMRLLEPDLVRRLEDLDMPPNLLKEVLSNNSPRHLERILTSPNLLTKPPYPHGLPTTFTTGAEGETFMRRFLEVPTEQRPSPMHYSGSLPDYCKECRYPDGLVENGAELPTLHESKVGYVTGMFARDQIIKDLVLVDGQQARDVVWHFFVSQTNHRVGPSAAVLADLESAGIKYFIHFPS